MVPYAVIQKERQTIDYAVLEAHFALTAELCFCMAVGHGIGVAECLLEWEGNRLCISVRLRANGRQLAQFALLHEKSPLRSSLFLRVSEMSRLRPEWLKQFGSCASHPRLLTLLADGESLRPGGLRMVPQAARVDSLAIAAGGLRAKGRLSFKTGVFSATEPQKAARRVLWDKNKNSKP